MRKALFALLFPALAVACVGNEFTTSAVAANGADSYEEPMPVQPGHTLVTFIEPPTFATEVECPDDGTDPSALDIRVVAQTALTNEEWLKREINRLNPIYVFDGYGTSAGTYESVVVQNVHPGFGGFAGAYLDFDNAEAGDILHVDVSGQASMQLDGGGAASLSGGHVALIVTEDPDGADVVTYPKGSSALINKSSGTGTEPHSFSFNIVHAVVNPGTIRFQIFGSVNNSADEVRLLIHQIRITRLNAT